jgi:hypothetical protein
MKPWILPSTWGNWVLALQVGSPESASSGEAIGGYFSVLESASMGGLQQLQQFVGQSKSLVTNQQVASVWLVR